MTQRQLDRSVARATGESLREIRRRGFSIADPLDPAYDPDPVAPQVVDWDQAQPGRSLPFAPQRRPLVAA